MGYDPEGEGKTIYGAWLWSEPQTRGLVALSYINWYFDNVGDYETSIVARIEARHALNATFLSKINGLLRNLQNWLGSVRPNEIPIALRGHFDAKREREPREQTLPSPDAGTVSAAVSAEAKPKEVEEEEVTVQFPINRR